MKRRAFLTAAICAPMLACSRKSAALPPPGELLDSGITNGHRLRSPDFAIPTETRRVPLLIIGAGIAGLSAGWKLQRAGFKDFLIVEMEHSAGGNSRSGENAVSAYPFGAHYLPLPTQESVAVRELLADLGALQGDPRALHPEYDERLLCHGPQERLYKDGYWQEGVMPKLGIGDVARGQIARFQERMAELKAARDGTGRRAFAIPLAYSSREKKWRDLDRLTMRDWLLANGFDAPPLHWYVNYACRDDHGTDYRQTSAWAGLHYFACRNGLAAHALPDTVLTAPEGNGWIVKRLAQKLAANLATDATVFRLAQNGRGVAVDVWHAAEQRGVRYLAEQAIWCAPAFVLPHVARDLPTELSHAAGAGSYAPWLVASLTLAAPPARGAGAGLAWDNVLYEGAGLGYVVATHQQLRVKPGPTVLTYYRALADLAPPQARQRLLNLGREAWAGEIMTELSRAHGDLAGLTQRLDVFRHGHAMIRPLPGSLFSPARAALTRGWGRLQFAHGDVSGMSLFEEANYQGVRAAEAALARLGSRAGTLLG